MSLTVHVDVPPGQFLEFGSNGAEPVVVHADVRYGPHFETYCRRLLERGGDAEAGDPVALGSLLDGAELREVADALARTEWDPDDVETFRWVDSRSDYEYVVGLFDALAAAGGRVWVTS